MEMTEETITKLLKIKSINIYGIFLLYGVLTLPTSVCTFASILGPIVSSIYRVFKETLGCSLQEFTSFCSVKQTL